MKIESKHHELSLQERLSRLGFSHRHDERTRGGDRPDYRHVIYHTESYEPVGRMNFDEALAFVQAREDGAANAELVEDLYLHFVAGITL